jgi:hypothetical protein
MTTTPCGVTPPRTRACVRKRAAERDVYSDEEEIGPFSTPIGVDATPAGDVYPHVDPGRLVLSPAAASNARTVSPVTPTEEFPLPAVAVQLLTI